MKKRKCVIISTLDKVKRFLDKRKKPVRKRLIIDKLGVNNYSLDVILKMLNVKTDKTGRIYL